MQSLKTIVSFLLLVSSALSAQTPQAAAYTEKMQAADILFLENKGQIRSPRGEARPEVLFSANSRGCKVFVTATGLSYQFEKTEYPEGYNPRDRHARHNPEKRRELEAQIRRSAHRVDMRLAGANPKPTIHREQAAAYRENYYNIPEAPEGILGVRSYEKLRFEQVYPGIDWLLYSKGQGLKYDFVVQPGADPALIRMDYSWADGLRLNTDGSLSISTSLGELREDAPRCYQGARAIPSRFLLEGNTVRIALEAYDRQQPLVIDPCVVWGTYYGGSGEEKGFSVATDAWGYVYLSGSTRSQIYIASGGYQDTFGGTIDAFLVQFDASGVRQWGTYYGGTKYDWGAGVVADAFSHVYLTGQTSSVTNIAIGGHQDTLSGNDDAFLVQFDRNGVRQWGTYYGGMDYDWGWSVATDAVGHVYLAGGVESAANIASGGHQDTLGGNTDAFLVQFDMAGVRQWGTYYGGSNTDYANSVATDAFGHVYLVGETYSQTNISAAGHQDTTGGDIDAFLVQFDEAGVRQWGTYYGGWGEDYGYAVGADAMGHVYLAGYTESPINIASGGHQNTLGGDYDAFLVQFNSSGVRQWGTYYGGSGEDNGFALATDASGHVYLAGDTESPTNIASGGHQNTLGGDYDAFLVQFDMAGMRQWATYFGGSERDHGNALATDTSGHVYLAGETLSPTNIASGGHQNTFSGLFGGGPDAFLTKIYGQNLTLQTTVDSITCKGKMDGAVLVAVQNGPAGSTYNYAWNNGATSPVISNLPAGTYTVTATASAGCSTVRSFLVPEPPDWASWSKGGNPACYNKDIGFIHITGYGGWGGWTYAWSNGAVGDLIENLAPGTYTVTLTDQGGCSYSSEYTVDTRGGEPVTFATNTQRVSSGEAIKITMDGGFSVGDFIWAVSNQRYASAGQPLSGVWDIFDGVFTKVLESDNLRYPGEVEILVAPQYFEGCNGDTVRFTYEVLPFESGVFIPEIYTPNGDGQTDTWTISLPPDFQNARVTVYNRAGAKVYEGDATMPWDGSNAPDGTYFYVIDYTLFGQQHALKGAVTILRTN